MLLHFLHLSFAYAASAPLVLDDVDFSISRGESFALLGPNGAGKTTLLRILCGRLLAKQGCVEIAPPLQLSNGLLDLSQCGILLENPGIYPRLSIAEYLQFFAAFYAMKNSEVKSQMTHLASALGLVNLSQKRGTLSMGMRQKVQILRALLPRPQLLLLDEPVGTLDPESRQAVWNLLGEWKRECGGTLIVSSHILSEMENFADSFGILFRGKLLAHKKREELCSDEMNVCVKIPAGESAESFCKKMQCEGISPEEILHIEKARTPLENFYRQCIQREKGSV